MDLLDVLEMIAILVLMFFIIPLVIFAADPWEDDGNYYHRF